jgi:hypothetical protein
MVLGNARITRRDGGLDHGEDQTITSPVPSIMYLSEMYPSEMYPSVSERSAIQYLSMVIPDSAFGMLRSGGPRPHSALLTAGLASRKIGHHIPSIRAYAWNISSRIRGQPEKSSSYYAKTSELSISH